MQKRFMVSHIGQDVGPFSAAEIVAKLASKELLTTDYVYDEQSSDWVAIAEYGPIQKALMSLKPQSRPATPFKMTPMSPDEILGAAHIETPIAAANASLSGASSDAWYIQKDAHRVGPLAYKDVIRGLQEKTIQTHERICKEGEASWVCIAEHPEFSQQAIRDTLKKMGKQASECFRQRRYPRFDFENEIMIHNNQVIWVGQTYQAAEGGCGLYLPKSKLALGQTVQLHSATREGLPAFNAWAEVVSTQGWSYGLRFLRIDAKAQSALRDFGVRKAS